MCYVYLCFHYILSDVLKSIVSQIFCALCMLSAICLAEFLLPQKTAVYVGSEAAH